MLFFFSASDIICSLPPKEDNNSSPSHLLFSVIDGHSFIPSKSLEALRFGNTTQLNKTQCLLSGSLQIVRRGACEQTM